MADLRPQIYWGRPSDGTFVAGYGTAARLEGRAGEVLSSLEAASPTWLGEAPPLPGPWFGGVPFDASRRQAIFSVPQWALIRRAGRTWAVAFGPREELEARLDLALTLGAVPYVPGPLPKVRRVEDEGKDAWHSLVTTALAAFEEGVLQKVVAARPLSREVEGSLDLRDLVSALAARHPACTTFLLDEGEGGVFVGATPETLLERDGDVLHTEALAGTLASEQTVPSDKELREHAWVAEGIVSALQGCGADVSAEERPRLAPFGPLVHLRTPIRAGLRPGTPLSELVSALHPTAAVGGTPRAEAFAFLRAHEGFERGLYAGAVGWVNGTRAHLCVGIRSALWKDGRFTAFAGAGLVRGSDADAEWDETERKSRAVLGVFGGEA